MFWDICSISLTFKHVWMYFLTFFIWATSISCILACWIIEKAREFQKERSTSSLMMLKPFTVWITTKCRKFLKMGIPDHLTCLLRNLFAGQEATVKTRHETMDWFKIWKGIHQDLLTPSYLTYMQSTSCKRLCWMNQKLESRLP